jgi:hypothetical protein
MHPPGGNSTVHLKRSQLTEQREIFSACCFSRKRAEQKAKRDEKREAERKKPADKPLARLFR